MRTKNQFLFRTAGLFRSAGLFGSAGLLRPLLLILMALMPLSFAAAQDHTDQRQLARSFPATVETTLESRTSTARSRWSPGKRTP